MKRIIIGLLSMALATAGLVAAGPAQAVGTGLPVIQNPLASATYEVGDAVSFTVDYANALEGDYTLVVNAPNGGIDHSRTWTNSVDSETQQTFLHTPTAGAGEYAFTVKDSTDSPVATVFFNVETPATPPPAPPAPPVIKRPSAPRAVHTTVASKKARLFWAAPLSTGGAAITGYQVKLGKTVRNLSPGYRSTLFTKLKNKRVYSFYVRSKNRVGYGPWAHATGKPLKPKKVKKPKAKPKPKPKAPAAQAFANCDAMHRVYPHGVGLPGAVDNGGVTNFYRSAAIYNKNTKSDRDKDGVACEA